MKRPDNIFTKKIWDKNLLNRHLADSAILCFFFCYFYKLYSLLGNTYFFADESKHAYVTTCFLNARRITFILPEEVYGMFEWSYPPLFHILSALLMSVTGFCGLKYFNLGLLIFFMLCFYALIRRYYGRNEAAIASLLLTLSPVMAINTVRYVTEMLSMITFFFSFFFLLLVLKKGGRGFAICSGLATGLLLLTKQTGFPVLGFYVLLLAWLLWRRQKNASVSVAIVIGISLAVYAPFVITALSHKVNVIPFMTGVPDWAREAVRSFRRFDSSPIEFFYLFYKGNGIILCLSALPPIYYFIKDRGKDYPHQYFFLLLIYLVLVMIAWHITNHRHTITLLPILSFLAAYSLCRLCKKRRVIDITLLILLVGRSRYAPGKQRHRLNHCSLCIYE